jgi:hypothetical protein
MAGKAKQLRALETRQTEEAQNNDETWQSEAKSGHCSHPSPKLILQRKYGGALVRQYRLEEAERVQ